jgi:hypothetical protein
VAYFERVSQLEKLRKGDKGSLIAAHAADGQSQEKKLEYILFPKMRKVKP